MYIYDRGKKMNLNIKHKTEPKVRVITELYESTVAELDIIADEISAETNSKIQRVDLVRHSINEFLDNRKTQKQNEVKNND